MNIVTSGEDNAAPIFVFSACRPAAAQTISVAHRPHSSVALIIEPPATAVALLAFAAAASTGAGKAATRTTSAMPAAMSALRRELRLAAGSRGDGAVEAEPPRTRIVGPHRPTCTGLLLAPGRLASGRIGGTLVGTNAPAWAIAATSSASREPFIVSKAPRLVLVNKLCKLTR